MDTNRRRTSTAIRGGRKCVKSGQRPRFRGGIEPRDEVRLRARVPLDVGLRPLRRRGCISWLYDCSCTASRMGETIMPWAYPSGPVLAPASVDAIDGLEKLPRKGPAGDCWAGDASVGSPTWRLLRKVVMGTRSHLCRFRRCRGGS